MMVVVVGFEAYHPPTYQISGMMMRSNDVKEDIDREEEEQKVAEENDVIVRNVTSTRSGH